MSALEDPRWTALPKHRRDELLEKHRYRDVCNSLDWWEHIEEQFKEECLGVGIRVDEMYFSGFGNQGDGACFEGRITDWAKYLDAINLSPYVRFAEECGWQLSVTTSGRYSHSGTMRFDADLGLDEDYFNPHDPDEDPLRHDAWNLANKDIPDDLTLGRIEDSIASDFRTRADDLFRRLEKEYDYLTSDEYVVERLLDEMSDEELRGDEADEEDSVEETEALFSPS